MYFFSYWIDCLVSEFQWHYYTLYNPLLVNITKGTQFYARDARDIKGRGVIISSTAPNLRSIL